MRTLPRQQNWEDAAKMPRINIEEKWWGDPRRAFLILKLGGACAADGVLITAVRLAQHYWIPNKELIPEKSWQGCNMPEALIEVGLAERHAGGIYLSGSEEHFEWWFTNKNKKSEGGKQSAQRPRDRLGHFVPKELPTATQPGPATASYGPATASYGPATADKLHTSSSSSSSNSNSKNKKTTGGGRTYKSYPGGHLPGFDELVGVELEIVSDGPEFGTPPDPRCV